MSTLPSRGRVKRLLIVIGLMEAFALSVFFAFFLAWAYSNGGVIYADMTAFGEQHAEYWLMWVFVPVITLATFYALESLPSAAQLE